MVYFYNILYVLISIKGKFNSLCTVNFWPIDNTGDKTVRCMEHTEIFLFNMMCTILPNV